MKNRILDLLQYSSQQYDILLFDLFFAWCNENATNDKNLQLLITNQKVSSWFMKEYAKNERKFLENASSYKNDLSIVTLRDTHDEYVTSINYYPKALLNEINKQSKSIKSTNSKIRIDFKKSYN